MYNLAMYVFAAVIRLAAFFNSKARKMIEGQKHTFDLLKKNIEADKKYIWIHAASLGEFEQGRPLMEEIKALHPEYKILLTFFSPSGYEVRKDYQGVDLVCYLPFDINKNVSKFLSAANPDIAVFIKYEFWVNYLTQLHKKNIPTYIVSAIFRPKQVFFKWYGGIFRKVLSYFSGIFVQDKTSCELLSSIGIKENVVLSGDTRFDRVWSIREQAKELPVVEAFANENSGYCMLVAGSTWPEDEEILLRYFNFHSNIKLVIAPHVVNQDHLEHITQQLKRPFLYYSQANEKNIKDVDCIIVDSFGILSSLYRYGNIAYIGGGFGSGIHNVLEAAVYGIPVIFGPNYRKFKEAKDILQTGAGFSIKDENGFIGCMEKLSQEETFRMESGRKADKYVSGHVGATRIVIDHIRF
ncbi:MAG: 3-deoxy-D-manno-octulosonic acid transferase [Candidatus Azobacteroides sp.]|nr:3-deoxy-D-manno-octulosonic acid transferase [Candidatus Azobacteroides sp.]